MNVQATIGHNSGLEIRQAELLETGKKWFDQYPKIESQNVSDICSSFIAQVRDYKKEVEASRKALKEPILEQGRSIDAYHKGLTTPLEKIEQALKDRQTLFLQEEQRKIDAARRAAEEEARKQAEEAARIEQQAAEANTFDALQAAEEAKAKAEAAAKVAQSADTRAKAKGDFANKAMSLRTSYHAEITDFAAALNHYKNHPSVREAVQKAADNEARTTKGTVSIPGVKVSTTQQAV